MSQYLRRRCRDLCEDLHTKSHSQLYLGRSGLSVVTAEVLPQHIFSIPFAKMPPATKYGVRIVHQCKLRFLSFKAFSHYSQNSHFEIRSNVFIQIYGTKLIIVLTTRFFRKKQRELRAEVLATVQLWVRAGPPRLGWGSVGRRRKNTSDASYAWCCRLRAQNMWIQQAMGTSNKVVTTVFPRKYELTGK